MKKSKLKKEIKQNKDSFLILARYLLLLLAMFSLPLIYFIFTPLTIYSSAGLLDLIFKDVTISNNIISIDTIARIQIIPACVAGSAYLLLLILNLSTPMKLKKRIYSIILSFALFFLLNLLRIFFLAILYKDNSPFFEITHKVFWYLLSTLFVIGIWFLIVKIFSIKKIPIYSDIKSLLKNIKK